jgi:hypothetical protein
LLTNITKFDVIYDKLNGTANTEALKAKDIEIAKLKEENLVLKKGKAPASNIPGVDKTITGNAEIDDIVRSLS